MYGVLSRRNVGRDKCPKCSTLNVDFVDLGNGLLGCFDCGSVFVTKVARVQVRVMEREAKVVPVPEEPEVAKFLDGFTCPTCGKVVKSKLALAGHMRSHKKP